MVDNCRIQMCDMSERGIFLKMRSHLTSSMIRFAVVLTAVTLVSAQAPPPAAAGGPGAAPGAARGGRGRGANRPPAGPTPRLPDDPYLGANAGKPDLGGNSQSINSKMRGIWQVPYIVDMQKQGKAIGRRPRRSPFHAAGPEGLRCGHGHEFQGRSRGLLPASRRSAHDVYAVSDRDLPASEPHRFRL